MDGIKGKLVSLLADKQPVLIAIGGYGGSGKTTLANSIQNEFPHSTVITLDDFALPEGGSDRKRFISQVLFPLLKRTITKYQRFDWNKQALTEWITVKPEGLIIIEGVSALGEDFNPFYDFRLWLECSLEFAAKRGIERDRRLYGNSLDNMWQEVWLNEELEYSKTEPWKLADLIIPVKEQ